MDDTYSLPAGKLTITLNKLSQRHLWRVQAMPTKLTKPAPPEGYDEDQALANLPDYQKAVAQHNQDRDYELAFRYMGAARRLALSNPDLDLKAETEALAKVCERYEMPHPDLIETDQGCGDALFDVLYELEGNDAWWKALETATWIAQVAGGADPKLVDEAIKSVRRNSGRDTATGRLLEGAGGGGGGTPAAPDSGKRTVRSGKRGKAVANPPAPVAVA